MARVLDLSIGDKVQYILNGTHLFDKITMFALMTEQMDDIHLDFDSGNILLFTDNPTDPEVKWIPFSNLGFSAEDYNRFVFDYEFEVKNIFDESSGKYGV